MNTETKSKLRLSLTLILATTAVYLLLSLSDYLARKDGWRRVEKAGFTNTETNWNPWWFLFH